MVCTTSTIHDINAPCPATRGGVHVRLPRKSSCCCVDMLRPLRQVSVMGAGDVVVLQANVSPEAVSESIKNPPAELFSAGRPKNKSAVHTRMTTLMPSSRKPTWPSLWRKTLEGQGFGGFRRQVRGNETPLWIGGYGMTTLGITRVIEGHKRYSASQCFNFFGYSTHSTNIKLHGALP